MTKYADYFFVGVNRPLYATACRLESSKHCVSLERWTTLNDVVIACRLSWMTTLSLAQESEGERLLWCFEAKKAASCDGLSHLLHFCEWY
jgi:hypothetical protein